MVTYPDRMEATHESLKDVQHQIHHVKPKDLQILPEVYQYFGEDKESGCLFFKTSEHLPSSLFSYTDKKNLSIYNLLYRLPLKMSKHISQIQQTF